MHGRKLRGTNQKVPVDCVFDLHDGEKHEGHFKADFLHSPSANDKRSLIDVGEFTDFWGEQKFQVECYLQNPPLEP